MKRSNWEAVALFLSVICSISSIFLTMAFPSSGRLMMLRRRIITPRRTLHHHASLWSFYRNIAIRGMSSSRGDSKLNNNSSHNDTPMMNLITSTKSNTVKRILELLQKRKKRADFQATVVEGPRMVFDLLENPNTRPLVQHVLVSTDHEKRNWYESMQRDFPDIPCHQGTPEVLQACSDTVTPQGIVATVRIPNYDNHDDSFDRPYPLFLVLDGVSDPGNLGTLLRSSVAAGVAAVLLLPDCCDAWLPKAVRSAMGCSFQVPILTMGSLEEAQDFLEHHRVKSVCAATMDKSGDTLSIPHYNVNWTKEASALVIGSEGTGLTEAVREAVVRGSINAVHVPMEPGIESLNAAVCGSVILFEYLRQCRMIDSTS